MTENQKNHYHRMIEKNRAMSFYVGQRLGGFCTFYITDDIEPYVNTNPWDVLEDNPQGRICYVNQIITDNNKDNTKFFFKGWIQFKIFIEHNFPNVKKITWRRWYRHNDTVKEFKKEIGHELQRSVTY